MSKTESFEDKIRQQLEGYEVPYEPSYWKSYTQRFPANRLAFWQRWYLPYLFSLLLFGGLFGWLQFGKHGHSNREQQSAHRIDTVVVEKTIHVRDTLVIRDTVYYVPKLLTAGQKDWSERRNGEMKRPNLGRKLDQRSDQVIKLSQSSQKIEESGSSNPTESTQVANDFVINRTEAAQTQNDAPPANNPPAPSALETEAHGHAAAKQTADQAATDRTALTSTESENKALSDSSIFTEIEEETEISTPERSVFVSAGPRLTLFSPWGSGQLDTYGGAFAGGQIHVEWQRLQLSTGLQYGAMLHEIDELENADPVLLSTFPGYTPFDTAIEAISILSQQLLLPVQLHYTVYERGPWRGNLGLGVLANYLMREHFIYDVDNQDADLWNRALGQRQRLEIAHVQVGGGLSYQLNQQVELQAQLHYNHAIRNLGLARTNSQGPSLQLGVNWLLTR